MLLAGTAPLAAAGPGVFEAGTFHSAALDADRTYLVFLPADYATSGKDYPILYFLHGMFDNEQEWRNRQVHAVVDAMRADEARHRDTAIALGAAEMPLSAKRAMRAMAKVMTTIASRV